jgi:hypothetical protein
MAAKSKGSGGAASETKEAPRKTDPEPEPERPAGMEGSETALATVAEPEVGMAAAVAREEAQIKSMIVVAKKYPRDEVRAYDRIVRSCKRPTFAEKARYVFPRGGSNIEGPSVNLAREMVRNWGNAAYGFRVVSMDDEMIHVGGFAFDAESNTLQVSEAKFKRLVYRKKGGWVKPDERDLRELVNKHGAICERNAVLKIMPPDYIEDALGVVKTTLRKAAAGEIKQDREQTIRRIAAAFSDFGVSREMIEMKIGHPLEEMNENDVVELRGVLQSLIDGNSRTVEHFERPEPKGPEAATLDPDAIKGGTSQERGKGDLFTNGNKGK